MKMMTLGAMFLPDEVFPLLLVLSGLMMIIGLRKLAGGLAAFAIFGAMLPIFGPIFDAVFDALPAWVSWLVLGSMVLAILGAIGLGKLLGIALAHTVGILLADAIRFFWLLPFRAIGFVFRLIVGRAR